MKELTQVRDAVIAVLEASGVTAVAAFPDQRAKQYDGAVAVVAVAAAESKALGFCNYLGEHWDEESGTVRERYGKQLEGMISVDVRAERAAECEAGCEKASDVLLTGLPEGIRAGELQWEAIAWEKNSGMFVRKGRLSCLALFVAQTQEEGETFLDFVLKGVMTV